MAILETPDLDALKAALKQDRLLSYARLRGGFPIPLAGATYWLALGVAGYRLDFATWAQAAFWGSGALFPLALFYATLFRNNFMKDKSAVNTVLIPTFISMLLFWAYVPAALTVAPEMVTLFLAVGMSAHWPVIGWSYGRTGIYTAHAVLRAVSGAWLWIAFPEHRLTWLPFSVAAIYLATVIVIYVDSGLVRARLLKRG